MARTLSAARALLASVFGFPEFRPGQAAVVEALLGGHSALAVFPTGGGKSLCYQLPALMLAGLTVVVSPLIALMKDQVDDLRARGIDADRLDSTRSSEEVRDIYARMASGSLRLLYIAPERLGNTGFRRRLGRAQLSMLAVDEAHCISEWGHNFRPDYLKLADTARELGFERVLGLTATATPSVSRDICQAFAIAPEHHIQTGFHRANLTLRSEPCPSAARTARLIELVRQQAGPAVVYVTLQKTAEAVADALAEAGVEAAAYHAGMANEARATVQDAFMANQIRVVVATIAFGMGIDKPDIRAVYHYNLPKSVEGYSQQVGRAGRDGLPSTCTLLASADDLVVLHNFTYGDTPTVEALEAFVGELIGGPVEFAVSRYALSRTHDLRPLVVSTALTYLELDGTLTPTGPFYDTIQWRSDTSPAAIVGRFQGERRTFVEKLLSAGRRGRTWQTLSLSETAEALGESRLRLSKAFLWLAEQGLIEQKVSQLRHGYRRRESVDAATTVGRLVERFAARESSDIERTVQIAQFAEARSCLTGQLVEHFGESLPGGCGHCGPCAGVPGGPLPRSHPDTLDAEATSELRRIAAAHPDRLAHPRTLARFVCGLTSPVFSARGGLARHRDFGVFGHLPFSAVYESARSIRGAVA